MAHKVAIARPPSNPGIKIEVIPKYSIFARHMFTLYDTCPFVDLLKGERFNTEFYAFQQPEADEIAHWHKMDEPGADLMRALDFLMAHSVPGITYLTEE